MSDIIRGTDLNPERNVRDDAIYSVTFRLADSIPQSVLRQWMLERTNIQATAEQMSRPLTASEKRRLAQLLSERTESYLDSGRGCCWLGLEPVAEIVAGGLRHFDGICYGLSAWSIMPNHVHVVLKPLAGHRLAEILHSWKSFTATQANIYLKRTGWFWQQEYHDHLIRDEEDFLRTVEYVLQNPAKAGLRNWKWVWVDEDVRLKLARP